MEMRKTKTRHIKIFASRDRTTEEAHLKHSVGNVIRLPITLPGGTAAFSDHVIVRFGPSKDEKKDQDENEHEKKNGKKNEDKLEIEIENFPISKHPRFDDRIHYDEGAEPFRAEIDYLEGDGLSNEETVKWTVGKFDWVIVGRVLKDGYFF